MIVHGDWGEKCFGCRARLFDCYWACMSFWLSSFRYWSIVRLGLVDTDNLHMALRCWSLRASSLAAGASTMSSASYVIHKERFSTTHKPKNKRYSTLNVSIAEQSARSTQMDRWISGDFTRDTCGPVTAELEVVRAKKGLKRIFLKVLYRRIAMIRGCLVQYKSMHTHARDCKLCPTLWHQQHP